MTNWIEPPPPQPRRTGCLAKGCFILSLLVLFLLIAGAIGVYYGLSRYSALGRGLVWAQSAHVLAREPSPVPQFATTQPEIQASSQKWNHFEKTSHRNEPAQVALTAEDLNNLIARNPHARGKAFVSMESNRLHVQTSLPLSDYLGYHGYYLNADIVVQSEGAHSLDHPPVNSITVNGQPLPSGLLGWKYQSRSLSDYAAKYRQGFAIDSFEIRDGKLFLNANGP